MLNLFKSLPFKEKAKIVLRLGGFAALSMLAVSFLVFGPEAARQVVIWLLIFVALILILLGLIALAILFVLWKTYHG